MRENQTLYKQTCDTYFPLWTPWRFEYTPSVSPHSGYCNSKKEIIYFSSLDPLLIIHEICHAVAHDTHGKKWQRRMLLAAKEAERHNSDLSKRLINEVKAIREAPDEEQFIFMRIEDDIAEMVHNRKSINIV